MAGPYAVHTPGGCSLRSVCYIRLMGRPAFRLVSRGGLAWVESAPLAQWPWLVHAFSTRRGGVSRAPSEGLNLGLTKWDRPADVEENRGRFLAQLGAEGMASASVHQIHSAQSFVVARAAGQLTYRPPGVPGAGLSETVSPAGDALMTAETGILLTVRIADCLPVLLVDPATPAVAVVHAGWRGAVERVVEKAVGDLRRVFRSDPLQILAVLGPSIRACCYEVGEEVVAAFQGRFTRTERFFQPLSNSTQAAGDRPAIPFLSTYPPGHAPEHVPAARLDLTAVAQEQLLCAGVSPSRILVADWCTGCHTDLFFSHRKEGQRTGRQVAVIGIRPNSRPPN